MNLQEETWFDPSSGYWCYGPCGHESQYRNLAVSCFGVLRDVFIDVPPLRFNDLDHDDAVFRYLECATGIDFHYFLTSNITWPDFVQQGLQEPLPHLASVWYHSFSCPPNLVGHLHLHQNGIFPYTVGNWRAGPSYIEAFNPSKHYHMETIEDGWTRYVSNIYDLGI
ncbi:hypothetical protein K435DRAFT_493901 [Dendrothele bispora CBS 962.96]|uniref:Uncharacterized protein n=1 Tax=Dendrothele bispora (strain CBS 962.96) TaxID=1314807 RepID=A0A4S8MAH7_DENBC|nr:hypothetical protein K435DRAFT_493901 [Dendrothele bispora CBS 962.96]